MISLVNATGAQKCFLLINERLAAFGISLCQLEWPTIRALGCPSVNLKERQLSGKYLEHTIRLWGALSCHPLDLAEMAAFGSENEHRE